MIVGAKKHDVLWVDPTIPKSLRDLKIAINDNNYYKTEKTYTGHYIKTTFDSDIICKPCTEDRFRTNNLYEEVYCILAQALASEKPFAIVCPKCDINYMKLMKDI